jgi:predicted phosphodiesterase
VRPRQRVTSLRIVRIAVLADVHGNLPALRAVLRDLDRESADAIVVAGDVVGGPFVAQSLELLAARPETVHWIAGNSEREAVAVYDGGPAADDPAGRAAAWSAAALDRRWRDALAAWPIALVLDGVAFCHGSPRRDDEMLTRATPDAVVDEVLTGVGEALVVGGHTHQQFIRGVGTERTVANAGSVGLPYEGRPGAFWMVIEDGRPAIRETAYDITASVAELRSSGYPEIDDHLDGSVVAPADPAWVAAYFEHLAGRGPHPGEPVRADGVSA